MVCIYKLKFHNMEWYPERPCSKGSIHTILSLHNYLLHCSAIAELHQQPCAVHPQSEVALARVSRCMQQHTITAAVSEPVPDEEKQK